MKKPGMLAGMLGNLCPNCYQGKVFSGLFKINEHCPKCDFLIIKEEGYFIGAMIASYFLSFFASIPVFLIGYFYLETNVISLVLICSAEIILLGPLLYRFSALFWLWLETGFQAKLDASEQKKKH